MFSNSFVIPIVYLVLILCGAVCVHLWLVRAQRKDWNKGHCKKCGRPWKRFGTSYYSAGFTCCPQDLQRCNVIWIELKYLKEICGPNGYTTSK